MQVVLFEVYPLQAVLLIDVSSFQIERFSMQTGLRFIKCLTTPKRHVIYKGGVQIRGFCCTLEITLQQNPYYPDSALNSRVTNLDSKMCPFIKVCLIPGCPD